MKNIKLYLIISSFAVFTSCIDDVLNKRPLDFVSEDVVWNDPNLVDSYLAYQYQEMTIFKYDQPTGIRSWTRSMGFSFIINISDEVGPPAWWAVDVSAYKRGGLTVAGGLLEWWDNAYEILRPLNMLIEKLPNSSLSPDFIKSRVADARFLRAYNYFALVKRYGGVPLITKETPVDAPDEELFPKRNSEQEIYDFIISEMDAIEEDVKSFNAWGRVSQGVVLALKCRAALYAGSVAQFGTVQLNGLLGMPQSAAQAYYQKSYDAAKKLISLNKYALYNDDADKVKNYKNIFIKEQNPEMIFSRVYDWDEMNEWQYGFTVCPKPQGFDSGMCLTPYLETAEEFENIDGTPGTLDRDAIQQGLWSMEELWGKKDPRFHAMIYTNETPWKGGKVDFHWGLIGGDGVLYNTEQAAYNGVLAWGNQRVLTNFGTGFGVLKLLNEASDANLTNIDGTDCPIFRYAEILLNLAEAAFELGKTDEALSAINQIRNRAGIAPKTSIDREAIRHERRVELVFEGHRYWDLRRWRIAVDKLSKQGSGLRYILDYNTRKYKLVVIPNIDGPPAFVFHPHYYYFPVTTRRTGQNPNLVENPGY